MKKKMKKKKRNREETARLSLICMQAAALAVLHVCIDRSSQFFANLRWGYIISFSEYTPRKFAFKSDVLCDFVCMSTISISFFVIDRCTALSYVFLREGNRENVRYQKVASITHLCMHASHKLFAHTENWHSKCV